MRQESNKRIQRNSKQSSRKRIFSAALSLSLVITACLAGTASQKAEAAAQMPKNPTWDEKGEDATWDCVWFGHYWQEDTNGDGVADQKDDKQPIKWRVLSVDESSMFLLADKRLDKQPYNINREDVSWQTCTLRSWLNGYGAGENQDGIDFTSDNFIGQAFSAEEKSLINNTVVDNSDDGDNDTLDRVYLLSRAEVQNAAFGFMDSAGSTRTREKNYTGYVDWGFGWWLRSPYLSYVSLAGSVYGSDSYQGSFDVNYTGLCVSPALKLDLSSESLSSSLWSYAGTVSSDGTVHEIAPNENGEGGESGSSSVAPSDEKSVVVSGSSLQASPTPFVIATPETTEKPVETVSTPAPKETEEPKSDRDSNTRKKRIVLAKGSTFAKGYFRYRITKAVSGKTLKNGKVMVIGLSKKGKKKYKLIVNLYVRYKKQSFRVTKLGKGAFKNAKASSVTLPDTVKKLPSAAFVNCKNLKKLTSGKLNQIAKNAFQGCENSIVVSGKYKKKNLRKLKKCWYKRFK